MWFLGVLPWGQRRGLNPQTGWLPEGPTGRGRRTGQGQPQQRMTGSLGAEQTRRPPRAQLEREVCPPRGGEPGCPGAAPLLGGPPPGPWDAGSPYGTTWLRIRTALWARPCPQAASPNVTPDETRARGDRGCLTPGWNRRSGRNEERLALGPRRVLWGHFSDTGQGPEGAGGRPPPPQCTVSFRARTPPPPPPDRWRG